MSQSEYLCHQAAWFKALVECFEEHRQFSKIKPASCQASINDAHVMQLARWIPQARDGAGSR